MSFDQYAPYGTVVESSLRVVTWNVWGRYGQWAERQAAIEDSLVTANPDVVCLVESWSNQRPLRPSSLPHGWALHITCSPATGTRAIGFRAPVSFPGGHSR